MAIKIKKNVSNKLKVCMFALYLYLQNQRQFWSNSIHMHLHSTPVKNIY